MNILIALVGNLYITGGIVDYQSSSQVNIVDVSSGETTRGPPMHKPRRWHTTAASLTSIFVFDGVDAGTSNSCEVFSGQTRQYALHYRHISNKRII